MNQTILKLIERATRKGVASIRRRKTDGYYTYSNIPTEVYRVEISQDGTDVKLFHYGTLTAHLVGIGTLQGYAKQLYIQSRSDIDSVDTLLCHYNLNQFEFHYYPSKELATIENLETGQKVSGEYGATYKESGEKVQ